MSGRPGRGRGRGKPKDEGDDSDSSSEFSSDGSGISSLQSPRGLAGTGSGYEIDK